MEETTYTHCCIIKIVDPPNPDRYVFNHRTLLYSESMARVFSSHRIARNFLQKSDFAGMQYELIQVDPALLQE